MKPTDKITLTFGQLKRLISEAKFDMLAERKRKKKKRWIRQARFFPTRVIPFPPKPPKGGPGPCPPPPRPGPNPSPPGPPPPGPAPAGPAI